MGQHVFRCPNGHLGRIDAEQLAGDASIVCSGDDGDCDFHGQVDAGEVVGKGWTPHTA